MGMGYSLAKENSAFVRRMLKLGRFNNQSEVVREALRRMEREEKSYLNPAPLSDADASRIYARDPKADSLELEIGRKNSESIRSIIKRRKLRLDDL
jgi:putative addiction module CopG family antidote